MMTTEEIDQFLAKTNHAIVGVNRTGGEAPQLTTVWYAWDGTNFYFSTTRERAKYTNIKRNPAISLIVDDFASHRYVAAYGRAEIVEKDKAELARAIIKRYAPEERVESMVQGLEADPSRVIVVLHPEKLLSI